MRNAVFRRPSPLTFRLMTDNTGVTCGRATAAKAVSIIFHPLIVPTYAAIAVLFGGHTIWAIFMPFHTRVVLVWYVLAATALIPLAVMPILKSARLIESYSLITARDRVIPMLFMAVCYMSAMFVLSDKAGIDAARRFFLGPAVIMVLLTIITSRWKISTHTTAPGATAALFLAITNAGYGVMTAGVMFAVVIAGVLGSARMATGQHTLSQVTTGFLLGFFTMLLSLVF